MGLFEAKKITSFEIIFFRISGMRVTAEYEIVMKEDRAEITEYRIYYTREDGDERRPQHCAVCSVEEMLKLLNECEVLKWDGFHGKHPIGVKDGEMLSFSATVNDGQTVKADGSENFPKHFREFRNQIFKMLSEGKQDE